MRILCILSLFFASFLTFGCSNYDAYRIRTLEGLKESHSKVVERAKEGKLTKIEFRTSLKTYDDSMLDEQAKSGSGLEELREKTTKESDELANKLFPGN